MKKQLSTFVGSAIVGALAFGIWPEMWKSYGIMGGFLTATVAIGPMWYMNHYLGIIRNPAGTLWIDQGLPIAAAGMSWGVVRFYPNCHIVHALPTALCCMVGGCLAGWVAHLVLQQMEKEGQP